MLSEVHMLSCGWLQHFLPRGLGISLSTSFHKFCIFLGRGCLDCLPCCSCLTKFVSVGFLSLHQLHKQARLYQSHGRRALVFGNSHLLVFSDLQKIFSFLSESNMFLRVLLGADQPYLGYILKKKHVVTAT